jgi:hypothetical protein
MNRFAILMVSSRNEQMKYTHSSEIGRRIKTIINYMHVAVNEWE